MRLSFPGSPSFRAIIPLMTFDPPERKAEGDPGRFWGILSPDHSMIYHNIMCTPNLWSDIRSMTGSVSMPNVWSDVE